MHENLNGCTSWGKTNPSGVGSGGGGKRGGGGNDLKEQPRNIINMSLLVRKLNPILTLTRII